MSRSLVQFFAIILFAFALFIVWDFSQRAVTLAYLQQAEQNYEQQVAHAQATQTALIEKKKQVQSPAFVETYVRSKWHYAREGETVVIPQITPAAPPLVPAPPPALPPQTSWWQNLLDFFFGP